MNHFTKSNVSTMRRLEIRYLHCELARDFTSPHCNITLRTAHTDQFFNYMSSPSLQLVSRVVTIVGSQQRKQLTTAHVPTLLLGPTMQSPAVNIQASGHVLTLSTHYACYYYASVAMVNTKDQRKTLNIMAK